MTPTKMTPAQLKLELTEVTAGKFSYIIPTGATYEEVEDTIRDLLMIGVIIEKALSDGIQIEDILAALKAQPLIKEIIDDFKTFKEQFLQLAPQDAINAVLSAYNKIRAAGENFGKVTGFIANFLYANAHTYRYADMALKGGQDQVEMYKTLFAGGNLFPDE